MARLKSRGRTELFRVEKEVVPKPDSSTDLDRFVRTLMSDGTVMQRLVVRFKGDGGTHDYGWKVWGKLKPGGDPKKLLDQYVAQGYRVVSTSFSLNSFDVAAYQAAETARKTRVVKQRVKRQETHRKEHAEGGKHGPGFYVTNSTTSAFGKRAAEQGPFSSVEAAEESAWAKYREFMRMAFHYLLPVQIVESQSRRDAEHGEGHVWWSDGRRHGGPVDPRQTRLPGVNGRA